MECSKIQEDEMRRRASVLAIAVLGLVLVPSGHAQQSNSSAVTASNASSSGSAAPAAKGAKDKKTSTAPKSGADPHIKPGSDYPHWNAFVGYSFFDYRPGTSFPGPVRLQGGLGSVDYNFNHWFGIEGEFGGYHVGTINNTSVDGTAITYLFGPRLTYRNSSRVTPFGHVLLGGGWGDATITNAGASQSTFTLAAGGGFDLWLTKHISWRMVQVDYIMTRFDNPGGPLPQNSVRASSGVVINWGARPIMMNRPPIASCSADKNMVVAGSGETVPVHVSASDPDGDSLTYAWSATGGRVDGSGADARWSAGNSGAGSYTVSAHVDDGHGGTASCSVDIRVNAPPPPPAPAPMPPTMSCSTDRSTVMAGERVSVMANANSPANFALAYTWRANAGQIVGSGSTVQFDTTGLGPGSYTITGRVDDGHSGAADCTVNVTVQQPPPPPQASKINECTTYKPGISRTDNACKRILDDVALRLQNEPKGTIVIIGYSDPKEPRTKLAAKERADNASKYLVGKGIDQSRITVRAGMGQEGAGAANRRIDIIWVPEGATY
jgi:outer membrane protein OmpA-like peptidoglycan-associated protein